MPKVKVSKINLMHSIVDNEVKLSRLESEHVQDVINFQTETMRLLEGPHEAIQKLMREVEEDEDVDHEQVQAKQSEINNYEMELTATLPKEVVHSLSPSRAAIFYQNEIVK